MAEESVKVAVRVRPFNQREKDANSVLVVSMAGNQTILAKPKSTEEPKKFAFDYSYWSHDGFKTEADGYSSPADPKYCDQKKVYNDLGTGVLSNAWNGYNASLFAYGQTGSGKSYSVVGYGVNKGIVPMVCEEIFKKTEADKSSGTQYEVTFSMLEIYSEIVRDLLNSKADRKAGLQVREDPKNGFFAQGLRKQLVGSYDDINKLMNEGTSNRTIAATNMNATSSRAHTIVAVNLVQKYKNAAGKEMTKSSIMNLVDLAGSERADQTGATGDRLKEGAAINLSLTALGNVISALADNSQGKNVKVPYRDSALTKLLMNALGGNSKTIMIAAISPADINYDESLSTLRYADRAKQIKCKPVVNEDPTEKLIKSLQEENAKLKQMLASGGKIDGAVATGAPAAGGGGAAADAELKKQLEENEKEMEKMKKSYEDKLAEAKTELSEETEFEKQYKKSRKFPNFSNVNQDPSLSGKVKIVFDSDGQKKIGQPGKSDIGLSGIGINETHAIATVKGNSVTVERVNNSRVFVNGHAITAPVQLNHMDRILFGTSQYFIFVDPTKKTPNDVYYTFEMSQDEIAKGSGFAADTANMSKEEIKCQNELIDLIAPVEEANQMSIVLDKKVKFEAIVVAPEVRGEYDGKLKPFVVVKNFQTGLVWIWEKNKFLDRKESMTQYYLDIKEDGKVDAEKFKNFDPFSESPDTPTQIGTAVVFPKSFAFMVSNKGDYKITDLRGKPAGTINIEILPCDKTGKVLTDKDGVVVRNPEKDLLSKSVNFIVKINTAKLDPIYEDVFCQFTIFNDPTMNKTEVIRGTNTPDFKFSKQFTFEVTKEFLINLLNKCFYIQVWGEQKHPKPEAFANKMTTKQYFDAEKEQIISGKNSFNDKVFDAEKQKLKDEINVLSAKNQNSSTTVDKLRKLIEVGKMKKHGTIPLPILEALLLSNPDVAEQIIDKYSKAPDGPEQPPAEQPKQDGAKAQPQQQQHPRGAFEILPPGFIDDMFEELGDAIPRRFYQNNPNARGANKAQQNQQQTQQTNVGCNVM